jgi:sporulation protein YlmC with PRC-barrel domain
MFGQPNISGWDTLEASSIVAGQLTTETGEYLGQISDLVIDSENGHILEVVLSDVQGKGGEQVSVPFAALSHTGSNIFVFNKPEEYRWRFSSVGGPFFEEPYPQWAEIRLIYSVSPFPTGTYHLSTLMGAPIRTPKGDEVAQVNDLVIDLMKNQVVYFVLSDVGEKEGKMVAVPFNGLSKGSGNIFTLHVTKERLLDSPAFTWSDVSNRKYAETVYRHYGLQPYWSEE